MKLFQNTFFKKKLRRIKKKQGNSFQNKTIFKIFYKFSKFFINLTKFYKFSKYFINFQGFLKIFKVFYKF